MVCVAKKVLAHCDLDLVLTDYYKQRLESQLKNREIHTNEDNSTESTELLLPTHLPVSINWISPSKPSTKRSLFPLSTPLPSPLSLSSLSSQSIPSTSCCNNITCLPLQLCVAQPTLFTSDLPLSSFTSTSIQGITPKVMAANTPTSESTSTDPQFQTFYVSPMPYPGAPGSPFFEGANISEFWERFENMGDDYQMSTSEKIRRLPWYCEMFTVRYVRSVIKFSGLDWVKICTSLKKEYKDRDIAQQISSRTYLEAFQDKPRIENTEVL